MKKLIIGFILGIILCSGIVYASSLYKAIDISYNKENWEVSNVNDALDELKNRTDILMTGDATASDIKSGKTAVVNGELITGTSQDVTFTTQTVTSSFSANSNNVGPIVFNFSFPNKVLGIVNMSGVNSNNYGDGASVGVWNNMISISGNRVQLYLRGLNPYSATSGTVTLTAIGY